MLKNETVVTMDPVNLDLLQKLDGLQILILGPSPRVLLVNHQWKIRVHFTCLWEVKWTGALKKQHLVESVRMIVDVKRKGGQAGTSKVCLIKCPGISHRTACHWSFKSEGRVLNSVMVSSHFLSWRMLQGQWTLPQKTQPLVSSLSLSDSYDVVHFSSGFLSQHQVFVTATSHGFKC